MRPRIYTIPSERPFLAALAEGLTEMAGANPAALSRVTVLLPTRRAVRSLREAFLRIPFDGKEPGTPLLLPRMRPIGDLDSDELLLFESISGDDDLIVPPAIPAPRRQLLLTKLILKWASQGGRDPLLPGQAAALAASLARLIDTVAIEGANFARLRDLVPADLTAHWEIVCKLLEILPTAWPAMLASEGAIDPGERSNRLLTRQAAIWRQNPPRDPVFVAGLSGGVPALTELIRVVAGLEAGAVILAGLDRRCDSTEWKAIERDEAHPQYLLAKLLAAFELMPADIPDWPMGSEHWRKRPGACNRRLRLALVGEAMRPAPTTDNWRSLAPVPAAAIDGLSRYDCVNRHEEALTISLLLRRKLETPGATAALVTPDRELARQVAVELMRWGIAIDDSAGLPLNRTPPGVFLRLVLDLAASELAPVPLLAALKHPLAAGNLAPARFRDLARRLEQAIRGPRPAPGFAGLMAAVAGGKDTELCGFVSRLQACLGPLPDLLAGGPVPLARLVTAHIEAAERLAASDDMSGAARLWRDGAGETAARFYNELIDAAADFPPLPGQHYPALFEAISAGIVVRPVYGRHPRLAIWGLIEARLQQADLVVLGGLNEGSWPGAPAHDPWMSRQMRREFAIAVPERAIGIAAHDFVQALTAPEAALTRAARAEGVPTVPSRWLLRLNTVLRAVGLEGALEANADIATVAGRLDSADYAPLPRAEPRPPLAARPRQLSVTQIETWLADPYAIYARHILQLRALDELDADPGRADLGIRIHAVLAEFVRRFPRDLPSDPLSELVRIGQEHFAEILSRPGAWAFWWPRFERIARWLVAEETAHRAMVVASHGELKGNLVLHGFPGGSFELTANADRIDHLASGEFLVIDYKTGSIPKKNQISTGFAPQLPLEAAILRDGSFGGISGTPAALEYWKLGGRPPAGQRLSIDDKDPAALVDRVLAKLRGLVERFDDPATPYLAMPVPARRPRFSDYEHLERVARNETEEWQA
jgi:ATP-dependent helicase/nuclease subunit B